MNLSQLITRIKISCGIYVIALPFINPDQVIAETIQNITLRTFSTFCPYPEKMRFDLNTLEKIEKHANYDVYLLPDLFNNRELLYVKDIYYDEADTSGLGYWGGGVPLLQGNLLKQAMLTNASLTLTNAIVPKLTFNYEHPRKVTLYNVLSSSKVIFDLAMMHDKNLASISPTQEESFFELAILDVKHTLYETLKHYSEITTAHGNINLKMEEWSQAESQREQLIEKWNSTYHMDVLPFTYG